MSTLFVEHESRQYLLFMEDEGGSSEGVYWGSDEGAQRLTSFPDYPVPMLIRGKYDDTNDVHLWDDPSTRETVELRLLDIEDYVIEANGRTATIKPRISSK